METFTAIIIAILLIGYLIVSRIKLRCDICEIVISDRSKYYSKKVDNEKLIVCSRCYRKIADKKSDEFFNRVAIANQSSSGSNRTISSKTKQAVWQRDMGQCVQCGSKENLEYDHIIPVSKGGSNTERNIQLLCQTCNRSKSAKIQ